MNISPWQEPLQLKAQMGEEAMAQAGALSGDMGDQGIQLDTDLTSSYLRAIKNNEVYRDIIYIYIYTHIMQGCSIHDQ